MEKPNLAFVTVRQLASLPFEHAWVTKSLADQCIISTRTKEGGVLFPLYLYPAEINSETEQKSIFDLGDKVHGEKRRPNFNNAFIDKMQQQLGSEFVPNGAGDLRKTFGPEDILNYMYAVFHSPTYRTRYAEFLKFDFARLPLTSDLDLFKTLVRKGAKLVSLHLLESPVLNDTSLQPNYPITGDDKIEVVSYKEPGEQTSDQKVPLTNGRVYINKYQYFDGIDSNVWKFHVGAYQVCQKWLKERKGRQLSYDDKTHYQKIVVAIRETITLMHEIDEAIPEWPIR
jgi:predicted helicase